MHNGYAELSLCMVAFKFNLFIPPVYIVYRGYIVFVFSVAFFPSKISQKLLDLGF